MSAGHSITTKLAALVGAFLLGAMLCAPFGAAHYYSLIADHQCTCDETAVGDAISFVWFSLPLTATSLLLGTIACWPVRRAMPARLAAVAAGVTLGALPYSAAAFIGIFGLADIGFPDWSVFAFAYVIGVLIGGCVWLVLSLGGPWQQDIPKRRLSAVFE